MLEIHQLVSGAIILGYAIVGLFFLRFWIAVSYTHLTLPTILRV